MTFGGRLDPEHATGPISRWMAAEGPLAGDFRDWTRIRAWAAAIAQTLLGARLTAE
jgi:menaquinone-dependent protoporphyrinogen oxidase